MSFPEQTIAVVTGATGFVATELVMQLLGKGYQVRATVRDLKKTERLKELEDLGEALPGTLEIAEADLLRPGSFDEVVKGAKYVFHVASPFVLQSADPQRDIVDPAVKGTENVLASVVRADPRPERVVVTSSVAAVHGAQGQAPPLDGVAYGPEDWNETSTLGEEPYLLSKALAERAAWRIAQEHGLDLVTVNPCFVLGPVISATAAGTSRDVVGSFIAGGPAKGTARIVDVRDVALIHIAAAEEPAAKGRYIASSPAPVPWALVLAWLREAYPTATFADSDEPTDDLPVDIDGSKVQRDLGIVLRPAKQTVLDMARSLLALGSVQLKKRA